jgi:WD40 repeat protein
VWDLSTGREGLRIDGGARRERGVSGAIALSPKSGEIFSLVDPKELPRTFPTCVGVWDLLNRRYLDVIPIGKKLDLTALAVTPDGKSLVVGDIKGKVYIVDIETKAVRKTFEGHRGAVTCLAVSADGKSLASGSADTTVLVWDLTKP